MSTNPHTAMTRCDFCGVTLDDADTCPQCGVYHGDPCFECGRRGYHQDSCSEVEGFA